MKWETGTFFDEHQSNFFGCEFVIPVTHSPPQENFTPKLDKHGKTTDGYTIKGFKIELVGEIAKVLNFTVFHNLLVRIKLRRPDKELDLTAAISTAYENSNFITYPYFYDYLSLLVPPGQKYSSFEKLFLAFEADVWIWIGITFGIAFLVLFLIKFSSKKVRNLFVGGQVSSPWYNLGGCIFRYRPGDFA